MHETRAESGARGVQQAVHTRTRRGRPDRASEARAVRDPDQVPVRETLHGIGKRAGVVAEQPADGPDVHEPVLRRFRVRQAVAVHETGQPGHPADFRERADRLLAEPGDRGPHVARHIRTGVRNKAAQGPRRPVAA